MLNFTKSHFKEFLTSLTLSCIFGTEKIEISSRKYNFVTQYIFLRVVETNRMMVFSNEFFQNMKMFESCPRRTPKLWVKVRKPQNFWGLLMKFFRGEKILGVCSWKCFGVRKILGVCQWKFVGVEKIFLVCSWKRFRVGNFMEFHNFGVCLFWGFLTAPQVATIFHFQSPIYFF